MILYIPSLFNTVMSLLSVAALTTGQQSGGPLTEDTAMDTDAWTTVGRETATGNESPKPRPTLTIHGTSRPPCTTTGEAARGSAKSRTGGKAAGVSTNEGGVEPGPIAHPPR